ncbi:hypothetical protein ACHAXS_009898, partial [Conticribra weissflogii]
SHDSFRSVTSPTVNNHPCPPGPLGHKCHESHSSSSSSHSSSSSSHSSSSSSSSHSSGSSSSSSSGYWDADGWHSTSGTDDGWTADGWNADGWAADGYHEESSELANSSGNSAGNAFLSPGSLNFWLMLLVAAACAVAIAAVVVGSRRGEEKEYHPLRGAVGKRMALFGGFADRCLGERALCGAQCERGGVGTEDLVEEREGGKEEAYREMV